eukprot:UN04667
MSDAPQREFRPPTRAKIPITNVTLNSKQVNQQFRQFVADAAELPVEAVSVLRDGENMALASIPISADVQGVISKLSGATFNDQTIEAHDGLFAPTLGRDPANMFTASFRVQPFTKDGEPVDGEIAVPDFIVASKIRRYVPCVSVNPTKNPAVFRVKLFDQASFFKLREVFNDQDERVINGTVNGELVPLKFSINQWKVFPRDNQQQQQDAI